MRRLMKGVRPHGTGKWRVSIMLNAERMTKVCYSYDEAVQTAVYFRSFLKLKQQGQKGDSMYTVNENGQIVTTGKAARATAMTAPAISQRHTMPQTFTFPVTGQDVRIIQRNGEPWFVAKDVCEALDYVWNGSARIAHIPEQWRGVTSVVTPYGVQELLTISEQGLYFFLGRSDKPKALPYQMWIAGEVLPAIRRTGGYMVSRPEDTPEELLSRALIIAKEALDRKTLALEVAQPKADKYDRFLDTEGTLNLTQAAKQLGVSARTLSQALREGPKNGCSRRIRTAPVCRYSPLLIGATWSWLVSARPAPGRSLLRDGSPPKA